MVDFFMSEAFTKIVEGLLISPHFSIPKVHIIIFPKVHKFLLFT